MSKLLRIFVSILLGGSLLHKSYAVKVSVFNLDNIQRNILGEFRAQVERDLPHDYMKSDQHLLKFLSMNDFSITEAIKHLHRNLEWRQRENADHVLQEDWSDMEEKFPYDLWARARSGNPILYIPLGRYKIRQEIEAGNFARMKRYFGVKIGEDAAALVRRLNAENDEIVQHEIIYDLEGDRSRSFYDLVCFECLKAEKDMAEHVVYQYPRFNDNIFVVNAPPLLEYSFPWISGIVSDITMHVLGTRESYEPFLLKYIEKDQFPKNLK